jgi:hypothetical protein
MSRNAIRSGLVCACLGALAPALAGAKDGEGVAIFNGRDLNGWTATGSAVFTVEDGVLVGTQTDGKGGDLRTDATWSDFDLRFSYRVKWPANSGVWFRDKYQFDILKHPKPVAFSGTLYCPGKLFLATNTVEALEHRDDWNEGRVLAVGDRLQMWLNGTQVADVRDATQAAGRVGVQVHAGDGFKGMRIEIRSMTLREVK